MGEVKRFINHSRFQNNFQFSPLRFLHFEGNMFSGYFLDYPSDMTQVVVVVVVVGSFLQCLENFTAGFEKPGY